MLRRLPPLAAVALAFLAACSGGNPTSVNPYATACDGVSCGKGHCVLDVNRPACLCDANYRPDGLACVEVNVTPVDRCKPNPCTDKNRAVCSVVNDQVKCACDPGSYESNGNCLTMTRCSPNPCAAANQTTCTVVDGGAVCSCNAGYAPEGTSCSADKIFDCAAQHTGAPGDSLEPDECPTLAAAIYADDTSVSGHTIEPAGDADWYQFGAEAGHVYRVKVTGAAGLALYVDVYAKDGATLVGFDHLGTFAPAARFKTSVTGPHYIRVRAFRANDTGSYVLTASDLGLDDYADSPNLAGPAAIGGTFSGELQFPADLDVVKLPLPEGYKYALTSPDAGPFLPGLTLELVGTDRTSVLRRSNLSPVGIITRSRAAGDYFLRVSSGTTGSLGRFSFSLADLGPDDHGDVPSEATALTSSSTSVAASFEIPADIDVFSFTAQAGHIYSFLCNPSTGGYYGCLTTMVDPAGAVLATSSSGYSSLVAYEFVQAGPFFIRTSNQYGYGPMSTAYTYRFEDLGVDDFGDNPATASPVVVGGTGTSGRIETALDKDVFSFVTTTNHIYRVTCAAGAGLSSCAPTLLSFSGAVIASSSSGNSVSWESGAAGTLYAQIANAYSYGGTSGSYTVTFEDLGLDDCGDTTATATAITPGAAIASGSLESAGDIDVYTFSATAPNVYRFSCTSTGYNSCALRLKNASGAVVQTSSNSSSSGAVVAIEAVTSATYFVEVYSGYSSTGLAYTYRVENLGPDDYGDDRLTASPLMDGASGAGSLETPTDVDAFSFTATALHTYRFTCVSTGSSYGSCALTIRNPLGTAVATGSGSSGNNSASYEVPTAGTYTIEIAGGYSWSPSTYTFSLADLGLDDHGDTPATATAIAVPTPATSAVLEANSDIDVFSFSVTTAHIYTFTAIGGTSTNLAVVLRDSNGTILASSGYSPVSVSYKATASGTWYAEVAPYSTYSVTGSYTYQVADLGLDDHGDTIATATALPALGTAVGGKLEVASDLDFFSISLSAATTYQAVSTGSYVYLSIYNSNGSVLTYDGSSPLSFTTTTAATYYVRVRYPYSSGGSVTYTVKVQ